MIIEKLPQKIIFGGMKHSGKTTHGLRFANQLNLDFKDLDQIILEIYQSKTHIFKSIREIYKSEGKQKFQELEYQALKSWLEQKNDKKMPKVLSLGGGIASNIKALQLFDQSIFFIYLYQPEETLFSRIIYKGIPPFLDKENPKESFSKIYKKRSRIYENLTSLKIDAGNKSKDETFKIVYNAVEEYFNKNRG